MTMHTYAEAREVLRTPKGWLEKNKTRLPHTAFGRAIRFSDEQLAEIRAMCEVRPNAAPVPVTDGQAQLLELRPARHRTRTATA